LATKIIVSALAAALVLLVYFFIAHTTRDSRAALISALAAGFVPGLWQDAASAHASLLGIVLGFFLLLCFLHINDQRWRVLFLCTVVVGSIAHPSFLLFVLGLLAYLLLGALVGVERPKGEHELVFFAFLFTLWMTLLLYKRVLVEYGLAIVWQNIPSSILASYFTQISVLDAVWAAGIIPFIIGVYMMYRHLLIEQERTAYLVMGLAIATGAVIWQRLIEPHLGLQILGITLVLLFAVALARFFRYLDKTKVARWNWAAVSIAVLLVLALSAIPSLIEASRLHTLTTDDAAALDWLRQHTNSNSVVLATLEEGHAIAAKAERGTIADTNFLLKPDAAVRVQDIQRSFTSPFNSDIAEVMDRYHAKYILWDDHTRALAGRDMPLFADDAECFRHSMTFGTVIIYQNVCEVKG
jgi:hypothetical protein